MGEHMLTKYVATLFTSGRFQNVRFLKCDKRPGQFLEHFECSPGPLPPSQFKHPPAPEIQSVEYRMHSFLTQLRQTSSEGISPVGA